ncbi:glycosyltransferase [Argonema galeatum]|uniref:glycosyltransferase n=1 Tax=Argonema galeatum TaxID=2942762 RepID=UPI002012C71E|nr:glycosyltransferase [Argonema galeatum]MCL1467422.1 glycosyltransferase [Argonema galeatum A003/A1]
MIAASKNKRIAFFLPNLYGGGAERVAINLLKGMAEKDVPLDLVLADAEGPYLELVPKSVRMINLGAGRVLKAILPLSRYLRENRPIALLSHMDHANVVALLARNLAGTKTRLVVVEHNTLSAAQSKFIRGRFVKPFMQWLYPSADAIVGVSKGVSLDLEQQLRLPAGKVTTIYNPVVDSELLAKANAPLDHPWFQKNSPPVFLAVGRLSAQKDFSTLIQAFGLLRKQAMARLLILGEGELRQELEEAIDNLGIADDVSMPGFVPNPYTYMSQATAFILSSRWEGLPTVLIEAMACSCPVISTDCPSGPKEILESGKYGSLIPIGDPVALSKVMLQVLANPLVNREILIEKSMDFSFEKAVDNYLAILK